LNIKKKLQVFVSSTYTDLKNERQAAVGAILKSGHIPAGMELFTSGDESQLDVIKRWIDDSDIYLLILGGRYGSIENTTMLSYTELEYDYAIEIGKPFFAVVIEEKALERKVKEIGSEVLELGHPQELTLFRDKVLSKISSFFEDTKDIKLSVHETISDFEARYDLEGWIHGSEIPNVSPLYDEISQLRKTNKEQEELLKEQTKNKNQVINSTSDSNFQDLISILNSIEIENKLSQDNSMETTHKLSLFELFLICRDQLVTGITNQHDVGNRVAFFYFNVCPKLQIHQIVINEKVAGVQWRRFSLTKKGENLLAYIDKQDLKKN